MHDKQLTGLGWQDRGHRASFRKEDVRSLQETWQQDVNSHRERRQRRLRACALCAGLTLPRVPVRGRAGGPPALSLT